MNACPICGRGTDGPHDRCYTVLFKRLIRIPQLYRLLAVVLEPGTTPGARVSGSRTPPIPVRIEPLSLRSHGGIVTVLALWEEAWRTRRGLTAAPARADTDLALDVVVEFLLAHLDWAVDQPENGAGIREFAGEVREITGSCHTALGLTTDLMQLGPCPGAHDDGRLCRRVLYADPYLSMIRCPGCSAEWPRDRWMILGRTLRDEQDRTAA
jgi:hypothetical protein